MQNGALHQKRKEENIMQQKSIVFTAPNRAELIEEPIPQPGAGEVLVRLAASTISSGTERANLTGEVNVSIARNAPGTAQFPRRSGYSSSGVVTAVGSGVTSVVPGDRVALSWSTHSQYVCKNEREVYRLDDNTSFSEAALWHIATFPLAAIRKCGLEFGESAIVMGMGILGMMAVKLLRASGAAPVIAADPVPDKRARALSLGADYAFDPFSPDFERNVRSASHGGVNTAIEVTGNGGALDGVLDCMAKFGRVALLGCTRHSDFTIDYYKKVHGPGISLIGAHTLARPEKESSRGMWTTRDDIFAIQRAVQLGRLEFASLVAETHSPEDAPQVYNRLAAEAAFPVVQFDWTALS